MRRPRWLGLTVVFAAYAAVGFVFAAGFVAVFQASL